MKSVFYRIQRTYNYSPSSSSTNMNELTALIDSCTRGGLGGTRGGRTDSRGHGDLGGCGEIGGRNDLGEGSSVISYFYYKEPGHINKFCPKLIRKNTQP